MRKILATLALLSCTAAALADTVQLNNGDKLTGTITEVNPPSVIVTPPYAGKLTISRDGVQPLPPDKPVNIVTPAGSQPMYVSPGAEGKGWKETAQAVPPP